MILRTAIVFSLHYDKNVTPLLSFKWSFPLRLIVWEVVLDYFFVSSLYAWILSFFHSPLDPLVHLPPSMSWSRIPMVHSWTSPHDEAPNPTPRTPGDGLSRMHRDCAHPSDRFSPRPYDFFWALRHYVLYSCKFTCPPILLARLTLSMFSSLRCWDIREFARIGHTQSFSFFEYSIWILLLRIMTCTISLESPGWISMSVTPPPCELSWPYSLFSGKQSRVWDKLFGTIGDRVETYSMWIIR